MVILSGAVGLPPGELGRRHVISASFHFSSRLEDWRKVRLLKRNKTKKKKTITQGSHAGQSRSTKHLIWIEFLSGFANEPWGCPKLVRLGTKTYPHPQISGERIQAKIHDLLEV